MKNKKNPHQSKEGKKLPVMFYHSIPSEEIIKDQKKSKNDFAKKNNLADLPERQIWLWAGVSVVMVVLLFFWAKNIPAMIKTAPADQESQNLFEKSKNDLSSLFQEQQTQAANIKKVLLETADQITSSTLTASNNTTTTISATTTPQFSEAQLKQLKSKLKTTNKK